MIELLVVIAVIALLLSIVLPSLNKAKSYAKRIVCSNNVRQLSLGTILYSQENESYVPNSGGFYYLWDVSFWMTDEITRYSGVEYQSFACPGIAKIKSVEDARFWQFSWAREWGESLNQSLAHRDESGLSVEQKRSYYRVIPYAFLFDRYIINSNGKRESLLPEKLETGRKAQWIDKLSNVKNTGSTEMVMDAVISNDNLWQFTEISGPAVDLFGVYNSSNHMSRQLIHDQGNEGPKPEGGNIGFADGHVSWRKFGEMEHQLDYGPWFWW